jgi:hypothetical protein
MDGKVARRALEQAAGAREALAPVAVGGRAAIQAARAARFARLEHALGLQDPQPLDLRLALLEHLDRVPPPLPPRRRRRRPRPAVAAGTTVDAATAHACDTTLRERIAAAPPADRLDDEHQEEGR